MRALPEPVFAEAVRWMIEIHEERERAEEQARIEAARQAARLRRR